MKKIIRPLLGIIILFCLSVTVYAYSYWSSKTMSLQSVKKRWGSEQYDARKFKEGSYEQKAKMAYSIMSDKTLIGKKYEDIRELFGPNDGYYITETMPAYIVSEGDKKNPEVWQIVFRMDREYKVKDIIMHKNCCD